MADGIVHYPWYFNDWLGSGTRAEMTLEDRAIYRDLLDHQAADGSIADSVNAIANLAMCSQAQAQRFIERWGDELFPVSDDGRRQNAKQAEIRSAIIKSLDKRSRAGQAGAEARWKKQHSKANGNRIADAMPRAFGSGFDSGSESQSGKKRTAKARAPNPVWDALVARLWPAGIPDDQRSLCGKVERSLRQQGVTDETAGEIQRRADRLEAAWGPDKLTPTSLAKNWNTFAKEPSNGITQQRLGRVEARPGKWDGR